MIGQACEFDYAGCQALKVLRADGYRTIVVNSNPATIMTDPGFADRTYLEPLDLEGVADVLARERPDALLPTMGGQTALNLALELAEAGVLDELGVELIGASLQAIRRAENRELFKEAMASVGLRVPRSTIVTDPTELAGLATPAVVRPAFTLGGHGGGFVSTPFELRRQVEIGLAAGHETYKLPFGHRGANHPVLERATGRVLVTSQNHGFAVAPTEAREATHVSLYDGTVEGFDFPAERARSLQFHPEAGPGPHDAWRFISEWVEEVADAQA